MLSNEIGKQFAKSFIHLNIFIFLIRQAAFWLCRKFTSAVTATPSSFHVIFRYFAYCFFSFKLHNTNNPLLHLLHLKNELLTWIERNCLILLLTISAAYHMTSFSRSLSFLSPQIEVERRTREETRSTRQETGLSIKQGVLADCQ